MAKGTAGKNYWALLLMILAGVVLGGFIGQLSAVSYTHLTLPTILRV